MEDTSLEFESNETTQESLNIEVEESTEELETGFGWNMVMYPMPATTNRIILLHWAVKNLIWGTLSTLRKSFNMMRKHPFWALGTLGAAIGVCPTCAYSSGCILFGYMCVAISKEN